ncbi:MAG: hypothetical protein ACF8MF_02085 [Phycisphaerales bacterium JB052]
MRTDHNPHDRATRTRTCVALCMCALLLGTALLMLTKPRPAQPLPVGFVLASWTPDSGQPEQGEQQDQSKNEGIRECVITLKSGRTISGELVREDSRIVVIGIEGIETTFQRRNIANIVILAPVQDRYEKLRATIADDDIDARLALVEWLRARKAYGIAIKELDDILVLDPLNPHAKLLHRWLSEYDKLESTDQQDEPDKTDKDDSDPADPESPPQREYKIERNDLVPLSDEQINLMRVYEIDLRQPPRLQVPDEVMLELMRDNPDSFSPDQDQRDEVLQLPPVEKLKLLFSLKARDLYTKVEVLENPDSLNRFKDQVHHGRGWLINACASTRCHGGVDAGSFRLINERPNTDETAFTNLYILENSTLSNGTPLIDFSAPERSPLLQLAMLPSNSLYPHPEIPRDYPGTKYRPIFRNTRDRKYQQAVDWIRSMYQPRPEYEFEYPPKPEETQLEPDQASP